METQKHSLDMLHGSLWNRIPRIALGADVVIAHAVGRGDTLAARKAVHTSVVLALLGGAVVAVLGELLAAPLLGL